LPSAIPSKKGWSSFCNLFFLIFIHQSFHEIFPLKFHI
jgi:hypothetical protein